MITYIGVFVGLLGLLVGLLEIAIGIVQQLKLASIRNRNRVGIASRLALRYVSQVFLNVRPAMEIIY